MSDPRPGGLLLELRGIRKRFGDLQVLGDVSLGLTRVSRLGGAVVCVERASAQLERRSIELLGQVRAHFGG